MLLLQGVWISQKSVFFLHGVWTSQKSVFFLQGVWISQKSVFFLHGVWTSQKSVFFLQGVDAAARQRNVIWRNAMWRDLLPRVLRYIRFIQKGLTHQPLKVLSMSILILSSLKGTSANKLTFIPMRWRHTTTSQHVTSFKKSPFIGVFYRKDKKKQLWTFRQLLPQSNFSQIRQSWQFCTLST